MKINYNVNYSVEVENCNIDYLIMVFKQILIIVLPDFVIQVLHQFAEAAMQQAQKPFSCVACGNDTDFIWKTRNAKSMILTTIFAVLHLPQMQVQCKCCGKKMFISRLLLGVENYQKMSKITQLMLAFIGSLTTFRLSEKNNQYVWD